MRVVPVPCLSDNYAYLVVRDGARDAIVVDPSEAEPVLAAASREGLTIGAVFATHHHPDHVGGIDDLRARLGELPVYAHASERTSGRVPSQTNDVEEGRAFTALGFSVSALHVPGHTLGAVAFLVEDAVFTGDTLFVAGCGRIFEGTPAMMHASLSKLAALPEATRVYCGHEYTESNLRFAAFAEPENTNVTKKLERVRAMRQKGEPTVPSTIGEERATNPFLRAAEPTLRARFPGADVVATFAAVRAAKDGFKG
jgi:hydroxyacylglutathione hydrolase